MTAAVLQSGFLCNAAAVQQGVTLTVNAWERDNPEKLLKLLLSQISITQ